MAANAKPVAFTTSKPDADRRALDEKGNSLAGIRALELLSAEGGFDFGKKPDRIVIARSVGEVPPIVPGNGGLQRGTVARDCSKSQVIGKARVVDEDESQAKQYSPNLTPNFHQPILES